LKVLSLGGSMVVPDAINTEFLKQMRDIIMKDDERFIIVVGGGATCRKYQQAAKEIFHPSQEDLDWIGIAATRLNAELVKYLFKDFAHPEVMTNPHANIQFREKVLVASGWKPGFSTDYDALVLAKRFDADTIINITNVPYVYDKNPRDHPDVKPLKEMSWEELRGIVGDTWDPGMNAPFDPIAAEFAQKSSLIVNILGPDIENLKKCLAGLPWEGTTIQG